MTIPEFFGQDMDEANAVKDRTLIDRIGR